MRPRRPADLHPLLWEKLPRAARLALASRKALTPEQAAALRVESERQTLRDLQRAVKGLEQALKKGET